MSSITESNITLDFPDERFFRLESCPGYRKLSGYHFKEMDVCWYDHAQQLYWLIELKDYSLGNLDSSSSIEKKAMDLVKKSVDTVSMFLAMQHQYPYAAHLLPCVPDGNIPSDIRLKLLSIIRCESSQRPDVQLLNNAYRNRFKPYAELFNIRHYTVAEYSAAVRLLPFVL